jgi:hypothetical protein
MQIDGRANANRWLEMRDKQMQPHTQNITAITTNSRNSRSIRYKTLRLLLLFILTRKIVDINMNIRIEATRQTSHCCGVEVKLMVEKILFAHFRTVDLEIWEWTSLLTVPDTTYL